MYRLLANLFGEHPYADFDEDDPIETNDEPPIEALNELHATYEQPIKSFDRTLTKQQTKQRNLISIQRQREIGSINFRRHPNTRHKLLDRFLPNQGEVVAAIPQSTFCGQFSDDGQRFISASQDFCVRLFDSSTSTKFQKISEYELDEVGWAILDTALSPDRSSVAYSTWSQCLYLVKLDEDQERPTITPLNLRPQSDRFSIFSLQYSADGSEIISGSNDTCVYIYDLHRNVRTLRVRAHENDVNAVRFVDNSNSLVLSGSDDGLVLVWDRRALNETQPKPVGYFAGHTNGITFVHSRMDTRYLISNSKDQSIKLWDMRRFADVSTVERCGKASVRSNHRWDYRVGPQPQALQTKNILGDPSVKTYRGHSVAFTLIRCHFSPAFTTGQRYIVTGSSDGAIYIYNVLTGDIERRLSIRNNQYGSRRDHCVRDVSWHPYEPYIISTSWDQRRAHVRWTFQANASSEPSLSPPSPSVVSMDALSVQRFLFHQLLASASTDEENSDDVS